MRRLACHASRVVAVVGAGHLPVSTPLPFPLPTPPWRPHRPIGRAAIASACKHIIHGIKTPSHNRSSSHDRSHSQMVREFHLEGWQDEELVPEDDGPCRAYWGPRTCKPEPAHCGSFLFSGNHEARLPHLMLAKSRQRNTKARAKGRGGGGRVVFS